MEKDWISLKEISLKDDIGNSFLRRQLKKYNIESKLIKINNRNLQCISLKDYMFIKQHEFSKCKHDPDWISLHDIAEKEKIDRSFLQKQVNKRGLEIKKFTIDNVSRPCIHKKDYNLIKKDNFRQEHFSKIKDNEIALKDVQKLLVIDRRNVANFLNKVNIEKKERVSDAQRKSFWVISLKDFEKLKGHRLKTADKKTREKILAG